MQRYSKLGQNKKLFPAAKFSESQAPLLTRKKLYPEVKFSQSQGSVAHWSIDVRPTNFSAIVISFLTRQKKAADRLSNFLNTYFGSTNTIVQYKSIFRTHLMS